MNKIACLTAAGLAVALYARQLPAQPATPAAAQPDSPKAFSLKAVDGATYSPADYPGRVVVLEWYNPDCPFVKKHYASGNMQKLQRFARESGVIWFTICSSAPGKQGHYNPEEHARRAEDWGMDSTALLLDPDGRVGRAFNAKTTPQIVVLSGADEIVYQGAVDSMPSADAADIDKAADYVRPAILAAMDGESPDPSVTPPYGCSVKY